MLVATVIETSDFEWCISEEGGSDGGRFLMIILNLACIEVIMHLEEQRLETALEDSELLVACFSIIESGVAYMANDRLDMLDERQKGQLYAALKNAFASVLKFLSDLAMDLKDDSAKLEEPDVRNFVCATIRILAAWLAEETMANRCCT